MDVETKMYMKSTKKIKSDTGFTLIELLTVIAIVAMFSAISFATISNVRSTARDKERLQTVLRLRTYLELYKDQNGQYPSTGGVVFSSEPNDYYPNGPSRNGDWIPGLAPGFVSSLPRDPLGGQTRNGACLANALYLSYPGSPKQAYNYQSDGTHFRLFAHCVPEIRPFLDLPLGTGDSIPSDTYLDPSYITCVPADCSWHLGY